jgi:copper homeostasis protein
VQVLLEVCVGSMADAAAAIAAGADRLELCSALELGGLTPSDGLVEAALSVSPVPVVVMVRPRAGGFCYDRHEFAVMLRDAERFLNMGASGIVFGILDEHGRIDAARSRELVSLAASVDSVFHRAIDFVSDQRLAIDGLIELGCTRVLTSGSHPTAAAGTAAIGALIAHAAGHIEIMPGGGINAENIAEIVHVTRCNQVHIGASIVRDDGSIAGATGIELSDRRFVYGVAYRAVMGDAVAAVKAALQEIGKG